MTVDMNGIKSNKAKIRHEITKDTKKAKKVLSAEKMQEKRLNHKGAESQRKQSAEC